MAVSPKGRDLKIVENLRGSKIFMLRLLIQNSIIGHPAGLGFGAPNMTLEGARVRDLQASLSLWNGAPGRVSY